MKLNEDDKGGVEVLIEVPFADRREGGVDVATDEEGEVVAFGKKEVENSI